MLRGRKETLFYTGDVCFHDQTLLRAARFQDVKADVLIMETTRGNRAVPKGFTRATEVERLTAAIQRALKRKGCVLIPSFALGRTQEILALLALLMREGKLKPQPIYIGGLGRVFTEIYDLEAHRTHRQHTNLQLHEALNLIVLEPGPVAENETQRRAHLRDHLRHDERKHRRPRPRRAHDRRRAAIHFLRRLCRPRHAGRPAQSRRSPARRLCSAPAPGRVTRHCDVQDFDLTAHANREDLLDFVGQVSPRADSARATATTIRGNGSRNKSAPAIRKSRSSSRRRAKA